MKVLLIDIDSRIPNLALKKIEKYHKDKGDEVIWNNELMRFSSDKIYVSCIFDWNKPKCNEWKGCEIGGSGYSLDINLPKEIDEIKPRINIGFTTRGCIRQCQFCIVPQKEGKIKPVGDIYDIWDGKAKEITLLDNNITALFEHFKLICSQVRKEKIKIDFNQGLDHRLLTDEICQELKTINTKDIRFAFDHPSYKPSVEKAIALLKKYDLKHCMWYVLVGFDTTLEQDFERLNYLLEVDERPYVMRHKNCNKPIYIQMARWINNPAWRGISWKDFINRPENKNINLNPLNP